MLFIHGFSVIPSSVMEMPERPHPGVVLSQEYLVPLGITPNRLARDTALAVTRLYSIIAGQQGISADTALRLGRFFETLPPESVPAGHQPGDPAFWLDLQRDYELQVRRRSPAWTEIEPRILSYRQRAPASPKAPTLPLFRDAHGDDATRR